MQCTIYDDALKTVAEKRRRTKSELGQEAGLERIENTIRRVLEDADISYTQVAGIGIGCPGPVEPENGIVRVAVNLGWKNVPVGKFLSEKFDCPTAVLNDVDAGVYGEYCAGAGRGSRTTFGLFPGTGIGGGCVYDGQILRGKTVSCMEVGHIKINGSERVGATGMTGTLETEASRLAIAGELAKLCFRGEAPFLHRQVGTELDAMRSKVIAEAVEKDEMVAEVVEAACTMIGYAVANAVLILCPDRIVLGGGLVEAMPDFIVKHVAKTARKHVFECYQDEFEVRAAELGDHAATLGAASWVRKISSD